MPDVEHAFISFNYDLILDRAVQRIMPSWNPASGYGIDMPFFVEGDPPAQGDGAVEWVTAEPFVSAPQGRARILKPHGSLNWILPYKLPYEQAPEGLRFFDGPPIIPLTPEHAIRYWPSTQDFQPVALPGEMPTAVGVCILPPSSAKRTALPFLKQTREMEGDALTEADEIVLIGWSVPATDRDQAELITAAVGSRKKPLKRLTVVNRGEHVTYFERVATLFGANPSSMSICNSGFVDFAASLQAPGCARHWR